MGERRPESPFHVRFEAVRKAFGGAVALDGVSLGIARGTVHGLAGENGAGKSTLGKVLAGIHRPDGGELRIDGVRRNFRSPADAAAAGIGMVHQELALCPELSVAENLCLGRWPRRGRWTVDRAAMRARALTLLARVGAALDPDRRLGACSLAEEQLVQVAAALGLGARLLVFDEPTSALSAAEAGRLLDLVEGLRREGITVVYVSHRLPEVLRVCDRISVLRDGRLVETLERAEADERRLVAAMLGGIARAECVRAAIPPPGEVRLRVEDLASPGRFEGVTIDVRAGEIVGLAGLVGAGRTEVARAIVGLDPARRGRVEIDGRPLRAGDVRAAFAAGIGFVPEDRKREGLVPGLGAVANHGLPHLPRRRSGMRLDSQRERAEARAAFEAVDLRAASIDAPVAELSGGNQQKVVLARWLHEGLRLLVADEPTRGVDVGAQAAIHARLEALARSGVAILFISSELPELLRLATRVIVMRGGRTVASLAASEANLDRVLRYMSGVE